MDKINKDVQNLLILGVVSIIISGLALYSFRDITFKNTKNLKKNDIKQQETQQELKQEYQDLLNNDKENINNTAATQITTGKLSILIPKFFMNSGFLQIAEILEQKQIYITYDTIDNFSMYKNIITNSGLNQYDIYLLPNNRIEGIQTSNINIGENPKPYFNQVFQDIIKIDNNKYIPYGIDPLIILKKEDINISNSRNSIFLYTTLRKQEKSHSMPLIRGIGKNDIRLLEKGSGPFQNYIEILYQHIIAIRGANKISNLENMLDTENIDLPYTYNFAEFKQLYNTIQKRDQQCKLFPAICLMSYGFGDIKFGFLSDLDILDTYFTKNGNNFDLLRFNNAKNNYPIRGWSFVTKNNTQNVNLANEFYKEYLSQAIINNTGLRNNTLSAVNNIYDIQKNNPIYSNIVSQEANFNLIDTNTNEQIEFLKKSNTIKMLKGEYSPKLYLQ